MPILNVCKGWRAVLIKPDTIPNDFEPVRNPRLVLSVAKHTVTNPLIFTRSTPENMLEAFLCTYEQTKWQNLTQFLPTLSQCVHYLAPERVGYAG